MCRLKIMEECQITQFMQKLPHLSASATPARTLQTRILINLRHHQVKQVAM